MQAVVMIQAAEISTLFALLSTHHEIVLKQSPDLPPIGETFLKMRKTLVQTSLETIEERDPALAAKLQSLIDASCGIYPFEY